MKNSSKRVLVIMVLAMAAWLVVMLLMMNLWLTGFYGMAGLAGGIIAFIASSVSIALWDHKDQRDMTEINGLPYVITLTYLVLALVVNTLFCGLYYMEFARFIPVAANLVMLIVFIALRLALDSYSARTAANAAAVQARSTNYTDFSGMLSELLSMARNDEERTAIRKLQETVAYSPTLSQNFNRDTEGAFGNSLQEIRSMLSSGQSTEAVQAQLKQAAALWNRRNGLSGSIR